MTLTAPVRRHSTENTGAHAPSATDAEAGSMTGAGTGTGTGTEAEGEAGGMVAADERRRDGRDADGLAVASFVLGLVGLLVMNILLGPAAIVMAILALARSTSRRGRAFLGLALGVADLVVLAVLVTGSGAISWSFSG
ncbi:DUF4190 domain-containing protein [Streptomyces sp. NPDC014646]|uniref:DUF4190 domain-containing protein n=1 Tax=unclassified Streptomyces TaxID=2593676 RepID=UPI0036FCB805